MMQPPLKLIVCGGRDYTDKGYIFHSLNFIHREAGIGSIIEGGCTGADSLAGEWAEWQDFVQHTTVSADWRRYGNSAGMIRNGKMLDYHPDGVVAFPGGKGTEGMKTLARAKEVPVLELDGSLEKAIVFQTWLKVIKATRLLARKD